MEMMSVQDAAKHDVNCTCSKGIMWVKVTARKTSVTDATKGHVSDSCSKGMRSMTDEVNMSVTDIARG